MKLAAVGQISSTQCVISTDTSGTILTNEWCRRPGNFSCPMPVTLITVQIRHRLMAIIPIPSRDVVGNHVLLLLLSFYVRLYPVNLTLGLNLCPNKTYNVAHTGREGSRPPSILTISKVELCSP